MRKKYLIGVREIGHPENFKIVKRVLNAEEIENFNPIFCRYKNYAYLVKSSSGDLSNPLRREGEYLNNLYIEYKRKEVS